MKKIKKVSIEREEFICNLNKRHHVYLLYNHTSQTSPWHCRMLCLDTPLFGENVCVHYNLSNSFIISTKVPSAYLASLLRIEERSVSVMDKGQKFMLYLTISNHDTE